MAPYLSNLDLKATLRVTLGVFASQLHSDYTSQAIVASQAVLVTLTVFAGGIFLPVDEVRVDKNTTAEHRPTDRPMPLGVKGACVSPIPPRDARTNVLFAPASREAILRRSSMVGRQVAPITRKKTLLKSSSRGVGHPRTPACLGPSRHSQLPCKSHRSGPPKVQPRLKVQDSPALAHTPTTSMRVIADHSSKPVFSTPPPIVASG